MTERPYPLLAREGWPHIAVAGGLLVFSAFLPAGWAVIPFGVVFLFVLQFFRDPVREAPQAEPGMILAPADGKVISTGLAEDPWLNREAYKISIFMNVFNVHSNRMPVSGRVSGSWYHPGDFVNAALDKASTSNERNALHIDSDDAGDVTCVQVAGLVARRILCYVGDGDEVRQGLRYGFIRFGSRVDLYLEPGFEPSVACGDSTVAGQTVIGTVPTRDYGKAGEIGIDPKHGQN